MTAIHLPAQLAPPWTPGLTSAALIGGFLLAAAAIWRAGPLLERVLDEDATEAAQALALTAIGIVAAAGIVITWEQGEAVRDALAVVTLDPESGVKLLVTLIVVAGGYTLTRLTKRFIKHGVDRDTITEHQRAVAHHLIQIAMFVPVVLFLLALWGLDPGNLLIGAGAAGIVLGLAARQTLGAALAGVVLLFSRPFEVGDWVEIDDSEGVVTNISLVNTKLRTFDDELVVVPNDTVTETDVVNRSRYRRLRIQVQVGVDYEADIDHAATVATAAMSDLDPVMNTPAPDVVFSGFGDSAVVLTLRFWIRNPTIDRKWQAQNAVVRAVKAAFRAEDIKIPVPQRELAGRDEAGGLRLATGDAEETAGDDESHLTPQTTDGSE